MNYFGEEAVTAAAAAGRSPAFYRSSWYRINYFFLAAVAGRRRFTAAVGAA
jgi:hypothetical protein